MRAMVKSEVINAKKDESITNKIFLEDVEDTKRNFANEFDLQTTPVIKLESLEDPKVNQQQKTDDENDRYKANEVSEVDCAVEQLVAELNSISKKE